MQDKIIDRLLEYNTNADYRLLINNQQVRLNMPFGTPIIQGSLSNCNLSIKLPIVLLEINGIAYINNGGILNNGCNNWFINITSSKKE